MLVSCCLTVGFATSYPRAIARRAAVASAPGVGAGEQKSRAWSRSPESFLLLCQRQRVQRLFYQAEDWNC
jgi:hypothetical protein